MSYICSKQHLMLRKFKVSNFKSFEKDFELDLTKVNGYEFNKKSIKNGVVNNAIIYGHNGVGKSNLALAIFDIVRHLTDKDRHENLYSNFLNAYSNAIAAEFDYEFLIDKSIVKYHYLKTMDSIVSLEEFSIDDKILVSIDRNRSQEANILLQGTETLNKTIDNPELSVLKYIRHNSLLYPNKENEILKKFFKFIDSMLYFRSLQDRTYLGYTVKKQDILEEIIENNQVEDFQNFLRAAGIDCTLKISNDLIEKNIVCDFGGREMLFSEVASTGTSSLTLFYAWYQVIKEGNAVQFVFIDEFDAFYHHALSELVVEKLKETGVQFILTTHNTSILSNEILRPDCYFLMNKKKITSLSNRTPKELREAHNIEKMYKAGTFNAE